MSPSTPDSVDPSRSPKLGAATENPRFRSQAGTAEDLLKSQTVGLVNLSDFRKRRAEALEQRELDRFTTAASDGGTSTPASTSDG